MQLPLPLRSSPWLRYCYSSILFFHVNLLCVYHVCSSFIVLSADSYSAVSCPICFAKNACTSWSGSELKNVADLPMLLLSRTFLQPHCPPQSSWAGLPSELSMCPGPFQLTLQVAPFSLTHSHAPHPSWLQILLLQLETVATSLVVPQRHQAGFPEVRCLILLLSPSFLVCSPDLYLLVAHPLV